MCLSADAVKCDATSKKRALVAAIPEEWEHFAGYAFSVPLVEAGDVRAAPYLAPSRRPAAGREVTEVAVERRRAGGRTVQHPIMTVVRASQEPPTPTDGEAMADVAAYMRRVALTLDPRSETRADLLASADDWSVAALLHGAPAPALRSA